MKGTLLIVHIMYMNVMVIIAGQAAGNHFHSKRCGNTSVYQIILIMANHIHMLTLLYMEMNMRLKAIINLLDLVI
jgi:hypothetical protein